MTEVRTKPSTKSHLFLSTVTWNFLKERTLVARKNNLIVKIIKANKTIKFYKLTSVFKIIIADQSLFLVLTTNIYSLKDINCYALCPTSIHRNLPQK